MEIIQDDKAIGWAECEEDVRLVGSEMEYYLMESAQHAIANPGAPGPPDNATVMMDFKMRLPERDFPVLEKFVRIVNERDDNRISSGPYTTPPASWASVKHKCEALIGTSVMSLREQMNSTMKGRQSVHGTPGFAAAAEGDFGGQGFTSSSSSGGGSGYGYGHSSGPPSPKLYSERDMQAYLATGGPGQERGRAQGSGSEGNRSAGQERGRFQSQPGGQDRGRGQSQGQGQGQDRS